MKDDIPKEKPEISDAVTPQEEPPTDLEIDLKPDPELLESLEPPYFDPQYPDGNYPDNYERNLPPTNVYGQYNLY